MKEWNGLSDEVKQERIVNLAKGLQVIDKYDELLRTAPKEEKESEGFKDRILEQKKLWEFMFRVLSTLGPVVTHAVYSVKNSLDKSKQ
jgi:hypothetical protein